MKSLIKKLLRENLNTHVFDPNNYLDDFYAMDFNDEYDETKALHFIQRIIDDVRSINYPITVYRGLNTKVPKENYGGSHWSIDKHVAESFGDTIYIGVIPNSNSVDIEQTIRTRVMNPHENEINVPDSNDVKIIDTYKK